MLRRRTLFALALLTPPACGVTAQVPTYRARVLGVFDDASGQPIDSVRVTDVLNGTSSLTTRTGSVSLIFLPDGGSLVRVQKIGYEVQTLMISISAADTAPVTLVLRRVTQLSAVVTKADSAPHYISSGLRGFEERRKSGFGGYFVSDSVLRANEGRLLANVIASPTACPSRPTSLRVVKGHHRRRTTCRSISPTSTSALSPASSVTPMGPTRRSSSITRRGGVGRCYCGHGSGRGRRCQSPRNSAIFAIREWRIRARSACSTANGRPRRTPAR